MKRHSGFETSGPLFNCLICGKRTRGVDGWSESDYCGKCNDMLMHDNYHTDNDVEYDDCDLGEKCPFAKGGYAEQVGYIERGE